MLLASIQSKPWCKFAEHYKRISSECAQQIFLRNIDEFCSRFELNEDHNDLTQSVERGPSNVSIMVQTLWRLCANYTWDIDQNPHYGFWSIWSSLKLTSLNESFKGFQVNSSQGVCWTKLAICWGIKPTMLIWRLSWTASSSPSAVVQSVGQPGSKPAVPYHRPRPC